MSGEAISEKKQHFMSVHELNKTQSSETFKFSDSSRL